MSVKPFLILISEEQSASWNRDVRHLDLDLDSSRQSPTGYHGDEVCTPTGMSEWSVLSGRLQFTGPFHSNTT